MRGKLGKRQDYEEVITQAKKKTRWNWQFHMTVTSINFVKNDRDMLLHLKQLIESACVDIKDRFHKLILQLRSATNTDGSLDKTIIAHNDILDAMRLACLRYDFINKE